MVGQTLGHYRILDKLGAGGMGEVYRAHDERLDRDVALKVLPTGLLANETSRKRFRKEALALSKLNHPNIATVHDFDSAEGTDFLVMEYIPGVTLNEKLVAGPMPQQEILKLGTQIAVGLTAAHEQNVVHRDLKPGNVRLLPDGRLKILDFGLAKLVQPTGDDVMTASLTETHAVAGTLPYMAPEQLRGQPADARSDIWALGVVLYEMAAGARPFQGQTGFGLSSAIINEAPPPLPSQVPTELRAVIERCLEKEPGRRYQRAGEVQAALEAIQAGAVAHWEVWRYRLARRRWLTIAFAAIVLLAVAGVLNFEWLRTRLWGGMPRIESLAVLPLQNLSGDPEQDYIAEGMHEALITDLAQLGGLKRVIARSSVMRFKGTNTGLQKIARDLKVDALITGAVLRSGDRVRITAQLINPTTEAQLWARSYERGLRDVLSLQNEIVAAITREVKLQLTPQEQARLASARPVNPEGYEAYLKGKFYLNKMTPEGFEKGLAHMQQAIEKDPTNSLPYAGLALGYSLIGHEAMPDAFTRAKAAALKASELGGTLAEAEEVLAEIKLYWEWDFEGAAEGLQRVMALNPNLPDAHSHYSWYLHLVGRSNEGFAESKRAQELDPLNPIWPAWSGWQYWWFGAQYDDAIREARKSLELDPDFPWGLYVLGAVYAQKGMFEEAIAAHKKAAAASPAVRWGIGHTYALAGRREEARKIAAELEKKPSPIDMWGLAYIHVALGQEAQAVRWLEAAFEERFSWMPWMGMDPAFAPLRSDPRFKELVRRVNPPK